MLNLLAALGACLGLANVLLAWTLFGTGREGDVWMTALTITQVLAVLSQLGVEQAAMFSARARALGAAAGARFDRDCMAWALLFGLLFALLTSVILGWVVLAFAPGFDAGSSRQLTALALPLLLQVAASPALYVLRQQLLLDGRAAMATALGSAFPAMQCMVLLAALASQAISLVALAWTLGAGSACVALLAVATLGPGLRWQRPDWPALARFARESAAMRLTQSAHNLLVVVVTNAALSAGGPGTVAAFQYARRIVDGLTTVTVGPHMAVLHAEQSTAWARRDALAFGQQARRYLRTAVPLLLGGSVMALLVAWAYGAWSGDTRMQPGSPESILVVLLVGWQLVIAIETIAAGVLTYAGKAGWMLAVNLLYIVAFVIALQVLVPMPTSAIGVAACSLGCQILSIVAFTALAWRWARRHFPPARHA